MSGACVRVHFGMSSLNIFGGVLYKGTVVPGGCQEWERSRHTPRGALLLQSPRPLQAPHLEEWKAGFLFLSVSVLLQLVLLGSPRLLAVWEVGSGVIFMSWVLRTFRGLSESIIIDSEILLVNKTFCSLSCRTEIRRHRQNQKTGSCEKDQVWTARIVYSGPGNPLWILSIVICAFFFVACFRELLCVQLLFTFPHSVDSFPLNPRRS